MIWQQQSSDSATAEWPQNLEWEESDACLLDEQELLLDEQLAAPFATVAPIAQTCQGDLPPAKEKLPPAMGKLPPPILTSDAGMALLLEALEALQHGQHPSGDLSDADWLSAVHAFLLPPQLFQAGYISTRLTVWQRYFDVMGWTAKAKLIVDWLARGLRINFVPIHADCQQRHSRFHDRVMQVRNLLDRNIGSAATPALLMGSQPHQVHLKNRVSVEQHREFVAAKIQEPLQKGVIRPWQGTAPITVISGLGVVVNRLGKKRLILDARYVNLWVAYEAFSYEKLADIPGYLRPEDYIILTDMKSGYHQVRMHPATAPFLGIQFGRQTFYFEHLPFGLASACKAYTDLMQEVYRPLRERGLRMTALIDDAMYAFSGKAAAKAEGLIVLKILSALGFFLSWPKCQLPPQQSGKFLGLIVNAATSSFGVPADKLQYLQQLIAVCLEAQSVTPRQMAKVAGVLISVKPAVHMAPLYTRLLFKAMSEGACSWDDPLPELSREFAKVDLLYWQQHLLQQSSKSWKQRSTVYHCAGDMSDLGYAGYSSLLPAPIILSYEASEWDQLQANPHSLSSVLRETMNAKLIMQTIMQQCKGQVAGSTLVYTGDNMGSIDCLRKMQGKGAILDAVRELHQIAAQHDVHLEFIWQPRTSAEINYADSLSRTIDTSHYALSHAEFHKLCKQWGFPTGDVYAGAAKDFHKAAKYFTMAYTPKTLGVNALLQDWHKLGNSHGRVLLWVFPPFQLIGDTLKKLAQQRLDAILILPAWVCWWTPIVSTLGSSKPSMQRLNYHSSMYVLGSRLPPGMRVWYSLKAYRVLWT